MRVALLSRNARRADAIGQQVAAKLHYFQQLGAEVRVYLSEGQELHPAVAEAKPAIQSVTRIWKNHDEQRYLLSADLVLAEFGSAYDLIELLPALSGRGPRILVDYHGLTPLEWADAGLHAELETAWRQSVLLWAADAVLVHSEFAAQELIERIGLPRERVHPIPCFIQESVSNAGFNKQSFIADKLKIREPVRILLFVGRLARNKQPEMLIRALAILNDPSVHGLFVGCQSDTYLERLQSCQKLALDIGVARQVHFTGQVLEEELAGWYQAADVFVLPSRHECFGMPVVEAMQRGVPVVCSDTGSLPEVVRHAGLSANCEEPQELAYQINRLLHPERPSTRKKVALVTHRFGTRFAGGAEKSLRLMATALQQQGYSVEVFTTCNEHESRWANTLPAGTTTEDGFLVHRYPLDAWNAEQLGEAYEAIHRADGPVDATVEEQYLRNSLGSQLLISVLAARQDEFAAILTGPYLFKLTFDVAKHFGERVLLAPCFHDEPLAKLKVFQKTYRQVGGLLFHTWTEARFTAQRLGIQHPRHTIVGTVLLPSAFESEKQSTVSGKYLVYVGRYCPEKGLDRLLQFMEQCHQAHPELKLVCLGQGPLPLPKRPWLLDLGFVDELQKRNVIAGALALVNLSQNESLSIVALEAWALGVSVIADTECIVLKEQVERAQGGVSIRDCQGFCEVVDQWLLDPGLAHSLGQAGMAFVRKEYASPQDFGARLDAIIRSLQQPLSELAREAGLQQAGGYSSSVWQERLSSIVEQVQLTPQQLPVADFVIEPLQSDLTMMQGSEAGTITLRIKNQGGVILPAEGPAQAWVRMSVMTPQGKTLSSQRMRLASHVMPGQEQLLVVSMDLPQAVGQYQIRLRLVQGQQLLSRKTLKMKVIPEQQKGAAMNQQPLSPLVHTARQALAQAKKIEQLPRDYTDVTEGKLSSLKKLLKKKLLHQFRKAYVDVAFRQQSDLNQKLITTMSLLLETLSSQDSAEKQALLQRRVSKLEASLKRERRLRRQLQEQIAQITSPAVSLMEE